MPQKIAHRRRSKGSIVLGSFLMAVGALPVASMLAIERFLHPQGFPNALIGIVAMGYGAVFLGVIVLALGIVSWLFVSQRRY